MSASFPEITLRVNESLEDSKNSEKTLYLQLHFITVQGYRLKSVLGKGKQGGSRRALGIDLLVVLSQGCSVDIAEFY